MIDSHLSCVIETWPDAMGRLGKLSVWSGTIMSILVAFLHRYLSPFVTGVCVAWATIVDNVPMMVVLLLVAALFSFVSLPAGVGMIKRIVAKRGG